MRAVLAALLLSVAVGQLQAQTTILFEDFERVGSARAGVIYAPNFPDSVGDIANSDYYGVTSLAELPAAVSYTNVQGTDFYGVQDIDGAFTPVALPDTLSLNWTGINITNFNNLNLSWFVAEDDDGANQDWDSNDAFRIEFQIDGGGFNNLFAIESSDAVLVNQTPRVDTNFDGVGDGAEITDVFTQFNAPIGTGLVLDLRVTFESLNAGEEDLGFDNFLLTGTAVPEPSTFALLGVCGAVLVCRHQRRKKTVAK